MIEDVVGTVIASGNSLVIAADSAGFRQRNVSPMLGQGLQVIGKLSGGFNNGQVINLISAVGATVDSKQPPGSPAATAG